MTEDPTPPKKPAFNWARIVLFGSLALNLLIVGVIAGAVLRHGPDGRSIDEPPPLRDMGFGPFGNALSPSDRRAIGQALQGHANDLRKNRDVVRDQFTTMLVLLKTTPFDAEAFNEIINRQRENLLARQEIGQDLLIERISAMSDEERQAFADRLEKTVRRVMKKDRKN